MTDDYERREVDSFLSEVRAKDRLPLSERKENAARLFHDMKSDPAVVAERVGWLLNGSYGYGGMIKGKKAASSKRGNREVQLVMMTAAIEWGVPARMVAAEWHKLTPAEKRRLNALLRKEIPRRRKKRRAKRPRTTLLAKRIG